MLLPIHAIELSVRLQHYCKICGISGFCVYCYPTQYDVQYTLFVQNVAVVCVIITLNTVGRMLKKEISSSKK